MNREHAPVGFLLIAAFYALGVGAVTFTLFTNRDEVGAQLAAVHGLTVLAGPVIMLLTIAAGAVVAVAFCRPRPWAFWLVVGYMVYLLIIPRLVVGPNGISVFANVVWPSSRWPISFGGIATSVLAGPWSAEQARRAERQQVCREPSGRRVCADEVDCRTGCAGDAARRTLEPSDW